MEYGISNLAIIAMRKEAREQSEMVSQLLFGEVYEIMERTEKWARIIAAHDGYEGWISFNQITNITEDEYRKFAADNLLTNKAISAVVKQSDSTLVYIPFGSSLPGVTDSVLRIGEERYEINNNTSAGVGMLALAQSFLNAPYLWGGRTHFGIDCSGLVQAVFRQMGINLKRDAYLQAEQGTAVDFLPEVKPGDVAFFDNDEGRIIHVGIMMNNEQIIHASGRVKIERMDGQGIYSEEFKRYTHKLRIIKRFL
ncbi:C40 family peptidase [Mucilaginibacter jinjuensis]|uniref:C40 family peptidase n=1 Tax=Mucilaginibacter jinjuensis TaxID=1176721 RepID=A0ABY7TDQ3_9SPHI|nr:C40 family peptidase [Mucilaginibacter jinjuensis]WCT14640.1 C40 family peptidase [Mucilaginibacter jinjuensis]